MRNDAGMRLRLVGDHPAEAQAQAILWRLFGMTEVLPGKKARLLRSMGNAGAQTFAGKKAPLDESCLDGSRSGTRGARSRNHKKMRLGHGSYKGEKRASHQCFRLIFWTDYEYRDFAAGR